MTIINERPLTILWLLDFLQNSGAGGKSDLASLVKAVVAGAIAGTSAGSSGSNGAKDTYGAPTSYGADHSPPRPYGYVSCPLSFHIFLFASTLCLSPVTQSQKHFLRFY